MIFTFKIGKVYEKFLKSFDRFLDTWNIQFLRNVNNSWKSKMDQNTHKYTYSILNYQNISKIIQ